MKLNLLLALFFCGIVTGCSKNVSKSSSQIMNEDWVINPSVKENGTISIKFVSKSDETLKVLNPLEKKVEIQNGNAWEPVSILYCDCDVPCPNPPTEMVYENGDEFRFSWDMMVENCVTQSGQRITEKTLALPGKYRVKYYYQFPNTRERKELSAEFEI